MLPFYKSTHNGGTAFLLSIEIQGEHFCAFHDLAILAKNETEASKTFHAWRKRGLLAGYAVYVLPLQNSAKIPRNWKIVAPGVAPEVPQKTSEQSSLFETDGTE